MKPQIAITRATTRLFQRATAVIDLDGWHVWTFQEWGLDEHGRYGHVWRHEWQVRESPSGVRASTLKIRDDIGLHSRALRRIEETHLMKFAIRDSN